MSTVEQRHQDLVREGKFLQGLMGLLLVVSIAATIYFGSRPQTTKIEGAVIVATPQSSPSTSGDQR